MTLQVRTCFQTFICCLKTKLSTHIRYIQNSISFFCFKRNVKHVIWNILFSVVPLCDHDWLMQMMQFRLDCSTFEADAASTTGNRKTMSLSHLPLPTLWVYSIGWLSNGKANSFNQGEIDTPCTLSIIWWNVARQRREEEPDPERKASLLLTQHNFFFLRLQAWIFLCHALVSLQLQ